MTNEEASIHLTLSDYEDLKEAIEFSLFAAKQELIQKADHVLLFSSKEKKWKILQEAAVKLGYEFPDERGIQVNELEKDTMEMVFHSFHQQRSQILNQLNQLTSFHGVIQIQYALLENYRKWIDYWMNANVHLNLEDIKLSSVLDAMRLLQWILSMKEKGICQVNHLNEISIPDDILHEIIRLKKLYSRLN